MDALNTHPELKENTIIILISDNGYSLGEKDIGQNGVCGNRIFEFRLLLLILQDQEIKYQMQQYRS